MRKKVKVDTSPMQGKERIIKRFALFPRFFFGYWIWMEWYELKQIYSANYADSGWETVALINKEE